MVNIGVFLQVIIAEMADADYADFDFFLSVAISFSLAANASF